jgi:hypothetical protein
MTAIEGPITVAELAALAARADENGQNVLAVVLLQIIRGWRQAPSTRRYLVNCGACVLDSVESAHRDRRRGAPREAWHVDKTV